MCGIVYQKRNDMRPAAKGVLKRYTKQQDRGEDGFGYVAIDLTNTVKEWKRYQSEGGIRKALQDSPHAHILFHHRFPTSTPNLSEAAHPIKVSHKELTYDYYVVHNGVISNGDDLIDEHIAQGYKYTTQIETQYKTAKGKYFTSGTQYNDSEVLAIELARTLEGLQPTVRTKGTIAYIVLQVEKASKKLVATYYGTNGGNPLTIDRTNGILTIASEGGAAVVAETCHRIDAESELTTIVPLDIVKRVVYTPPTSYHNGYDYSGYGYASTNKTIGFGAQDEIDAEDAYELKLSAERAMAVDGADDWEADDYLDAQIEDCENDMEIARQAQEWDELETLEIEHFELIAERNAMYIKKYERTSKV